MPEFPCLNSRFFELLARSVSSGDSLSEAPVNDRDPNEDGEMLILFNAFRMIKVIIELAHLERIRHNEIVQLTLLAFAKADAKAFR